MRILHISDTHGYHWRLYNLPPADVIVHSGDLTANGEDEEVYDFIQWFENLDYTYKIFIPGNHDINLYDAQLEGLAKNIYALYNSGITIENIHFYGIPFYACFSNTLRYQQMINAIPTGTDVLITHQPPLGVLDKNVTNGGNFDLLNKVYQIHPQLHLYGHIHENEGIETIDDITFSNAALGNRGHYEKWHLFDI